MREQIIVALEAALNASPDINTVFRQFKPLDTISSSQFPCVILEEDLPEVGFVWKTGGFADVTFQLSIMIGVSSRQSVATELTRVDVAVKKVLAANPTLGGTCVHLTPEAETQRLGTEFAPYGMSIRPVSIMYEGSAANGY